METQVVTKADVQPKTIPADDKTHKTLFELYRNFYEKKEPIEVIRATCHQAVAVPRGAAETTLAKSKGISMLWTPDGLFCDYKGQQFIVPAANVVCYFLTELANTSHVKR